MGWDAFSQPFRPSYSDGGWDDPNYGDPLWVPVAKKVRDEFGTVDGLLPHGGLDVSTCGDMLERATKKSVYGPDWSPRKVKQLAESARWNFTVPKEEQWAKASAKVFLEHCAVLNRGVRFSW